MAGSEDSKTTMESEELIVPVEHVLAVLQVSL